MRLKPLRIAMWSGPRNISTALMRAWENREDCTVWDEPLYGYYLDTTGIRHPGAEEIIAAQGNDWASIASRCIGNVPEGRPIFYQKHMTLHLLPAINRDWLCQLDNCFLIREPDRVIASYAAIREHPTLEDTGFAQQARLFDYVCEISGSIPPVIDSREFLINPEAMLRALCDRLGLPFDPVMLNWPAGPRKSDGVWAKYWYASVCKSTGFAPYRHSPLSLSPDERVIAEQARPHYEYLYPHRLRP